MQPASSEKAQQEHVSQRHAWRHSPLPAPVFAISLLLIAYFLVGVAWHATTWSQYDFAVDVEGYFGMAVELGSLIAGIFVLARLRFARAIGLWVCLLGLIFQLYANATEINGWWSLARAFWIVWLDPIFLCVFLVGVVVFARWHPEAAPRKLA